MPELEWLYMTLVPIIGTLPALAVLFLVGFTGTIMTLHLIIMPYFRYLFSDSSRRSRR